MSWDIFSKSKIQYFLQKLKDKFVQKETGKGLSTNDFDNTYKSKVDKIDVSLTSVSGNPISISGLKANQLAVNPIITLEPIQDLHGQSKPYPAGGGKNLYSGTNVTISSALYSSVSLDKPIPAGTYTVSAKLSSELTTGARVSFRKADNSSINLVDISYVADGRGYGTLTLSEDAYKLYFYYSTTTSGAGTRTWSDVQIESGSQATSYAPYENICPISGYDKIEVLSCGKNLLQKPFVYYDDITRNKANSFLIGAGTYTFSFATTTATSWRFCVSMFDEDGNALTDTTYCPNSDMQYNSGYGGWMNKGNRTYKEITLSIVVQCYIRITFCVGDTSSSTTMTNAQLELGSSATTYEPCNKTTDLSESLGQTVYGGMWTVRTGNLKNIFKKVTYTWGNGAGSTSVGTNVRRNFTLPTDAVTSSTAIRNKAISDKAPMVANYTQDSIHFYVGASAVYIFMPSDTDSSLTIDICYVATGEIQLTPHEISLLEDYAYVSTNGTNISLNYHNGELASLADVSQLGETVNEGLDCLKDYVKANYRGGNIDISGYSGSNKYKIPNDGYINVDSKTNTSGYARVVIQDSGEHNLAFCYMNVTAAYQIQSVFVRKGMLAYVQANTANAGITYVPLA